MLQLVQRQQQRADRQNQKRRPHGIETLDLRRTLAPLWRGRGDPTMSLAPAPFSFRYEDTFRIANQLEAYERLIHDALVGDRTLFTRADGIERLWDVSAPVLSEPPASHSYEPGSWGPTAADDLVAPSGWYLR